MPSVVRTRTSPMRKSALIMERGEALAESRPADHLCDPPSRELCNWRELAIRALSKWGRRLTIFLEISDI